MKQAWVVAGVAAVVCAGCALGEQLDDDGGDVSSVAKKALRPCKTKKKDKPKTHEHDCYTTTTVGPTGGVVEHPGGVTLTVPAGAVDSSVEISVRDEGAPGPTGTQMFSPVFTFEPDGTLFARPVQVQFDVGTAPEATVYWTRTTPGGIVWDRIPATVAGGIATSQITHFSGGGAGEPSDAFDLHIIQTVTWDRLDSQHIERTDFASGAAVAHAPGGDVFSEAWVDGTGTPVLGEGMIRNVPAGEMWIQVGIGWVYTSLAATPVLDLSSEQFGTFGRGTPDINQTHPVTINVTGAATTTAEDSFELLVPDANAFYFAFPEDAGSPVVTPGITNPTFAWDLNSPPAVDNFITTDDVAYFAQIVPATTAPPASLPYKQMIKIGIADPADVPQSGGTLNVALADLDTNANPAYSYSIAAGEYQSMFATPSPGATSYLSPPDDESSGWPSDVRFFNVFDLDVASGFFDVQGEAGGRNVGVVGATADFAYMNIPGATMSGTLVTGPLPYGVPTGNWDIFAGLGGNQAFVVQLRCPPAPPACPTPAGWARQQNGDALFTNWNDSRLVNTTTFAPTIGPARAVQIEGLDAQVLRSGVGTEPTISWSPTMTVPSSGRALVAPQMYVVILFHYRLVEIGGFWRTHRERVASFKTPYTSVTIPAGMLDAGEVYSFVVRAVRRDPTAGISVLAEPNRYRYPAQDWTTASAPFTP